MPGFEATRDAVSQGLVAAILIGVFALLAAERAVDLNVILLLFSMVALAGVGLAEKDGKRISFAEFTRYGVRVIAITLANSSAYLVLWLYVR